MAYLAEKEAVVHPDADRRLPVVDVSALLDGGAVERHLAAAELNDAASRSGAFYIAGHGVSRHLIDEIFAASRRFHLMPRVYKMRYWCGFSTHHRGYVPFEENRADFPAKIDFTEAWDLSFEAPADHPDYLAKWRMTGPNVWPDIPGWRHTVSAYYSAVFALGLTLLDAFASAWGVDAASLRRHVKNPTSRLRLLRNLGKETQKSPIGLDSGPRSGFACFSLLLQGGPGLQVRARDGTSVEAPPLPGTFLVTAGDILEIWTAGAVRASQQRVVTSGLERYAMAFSFGLDYHAVVRPLERFAAADSLAAYPPVTAGRQLLRSMIDDFRYLADAADKGLLPEEAAAAEELLAA